MGLICFDQVIAPLECAGRIFDLIGERRFENLARDGVLQFIHFEGYDLVWLESATVGYGALATGTRNLGESWETIVRQFRPGIGKEQEAKALLSLIEKCTINVDLSVGVNFADICNGLFVSPAIRRVLGIGEGTPVGRIPRWAVHPALRVVQMARIGTACQKLNLGSMKLMPGAARLAELAFSAVTRGVLASQSGAYTLTGKFGVIAEAEFMSQPGLWDSIVEFHNSSIGGNLRREIRTRLAANEGAELIGAIDSSLREMVPPQVLDRSRVEMSSLLLANQVKEIVPAIWSDSTLLEDGPAIWRANTRKRLDQYLATEKRGPYDQCPCGSYEKVKFCCMAAVST